MEYKIISFEPKEASEEFWVKYYEFIKANSNFQNPEDPVPNKEALIQRQKTDVPNYLIKRWLAITPKQEVIGWAGFGTAKDSSPDYEANKHLCNINLQVLHDHYRQGIGTELLKIVVQEAMAFNKTVIETGTEHDSGRAFLKHFGATHAIEAAENRLNMEDVDWDLMKNWMVEGSRKTHEVTIESFEVIPEDILEEFAEMYTEALNMQPLGDLEEKPIFDGKRMRELESRYKKTGRKNYTLISREEDGRMSGLTEVNYEPRDPHRIEQGLTGVRPEFRGRGLGKWLKALMIFHVKENYPKVEIVVTGNAEANAPMLSVNQRMGFKKYKSGDAYKFKIEEISKKLGL